MPIKRAIAKTNFSIQPLPVTASQPLIGSLPVINKPVEEVPDVISQGDSYFSKDSIGITKFESRMMPNLSLDGSISRISSSSFSILRDYGLSPERISIISKIDFPSSLEENEIEENLAVLDLEEKLLVEDYDFIKSYIKNDATVSGVVSNLEGLAALDEIKCKDLIEAIQNITFASEDLSKNLDFVRYENSLQIKSKSKSFYQTFQSLFEMPFDDSFFISKASSTFITTSAMDALRNSKNTYYKEFENYAIKNGIIAGAFRDIRNNEAISEEMQIAILCQFLSKIFTDTFIDSNASKIKTQYNDCNIFESQDLIGTNGITSIDNSSIITKSHKTGIINPAVAALDTKKIDEFEIALNEIFSNINSRKNSGLLDSNNCTSFNILIIVLRAIIDSFSTSFTETGNLNPDLNKNEIIDAILILFSLYKKSSDQKTVSGFSDFLRGIILTSILDEDFYFSKSDDGKFETVSNSKTEVTSDISGSQTYTVKSGVNVSQNATFEQSGINYNAIYENENRKMNFTQEGLDYGEKVMRLLDLGAGTGQTLDKLFYEDYENTPYCDSNSSILNRAVPQVIFESFFGEKQLVSDNYFVNRLKEFKDSTYGKTAIAEIDVIYKSIISIFETMSGKSADDVIVNNEFVIGNKKLHKRVVYDAIVECLALFFDRIKIGYSIKVSNYERDVSLDSIDETKYTAEQLQEIFDKAVNGNLTESVTTRYLDFDDKSFNHLRFLKKCITVRDLKELSSFEYMNFNKRTLTEAIKFSYGFHVEARSSYSILKIAMDLIFQSLANLKNSITTTKSKVDELGYIPEIFSNITPEISANIGSKFNNNFSIWSPISLNKTNISAARWFYKNLSKNGLIIVGLPSGFTDGCRRSTSIVDNNFVFINENDEPKNILKFVLDARLIENSFKSLDLTELNSSLGRFHPLISVKIISDIPDSGITDISKSNSIEISCFDLQSGKWIVNTYEECLNFIALNNLNSNSTTNEIDEYSDIIDSHTLDAIIKNSITTLCGFDFTSNLIGQGLPKITSKKANDLLTIIAGLDGDIIPRRGLTANNFLTANSDGTYSPVPFSKLDGESSNLITPSDYSLLLKFISSGIFTSEWMYKESINPGIFEKIYCIPVDLNGLDTSLLSIKVEMK